MSWITLSFSLVVRGNLRLCQITVLFLSRILYRFKNSLVSNHLWDIRPRPLLTSFMARILTYSPVSDHSAIITYNNCKKPLFNCHKSSVFNSADKACLQIVAVDLYYEKDGDNTICVKKWIVKLMWNVLYKVSKVPTAIRCETLLPVV